MCRKGILGLKLSDGEIVGLVRGHRWPNGVKYPYCGSRQVYRNGKVQCKPYLQCYICRSCGKQFNDLTGMPLAWAQVPPSTALAILYFYHKLGLSQSAVARELSIARTTVIRMLRKFGKSLEAWFRILEA